MKKLAGLLVCAAALSAQADHSFTGFYLTGALGGTQADFDSTPYLGTAGYDFFLGEYHIYGTSPSGLIGLSYLYQFNRGLVLGGQVTAGYTSVKTGNLNEVIGSHSSPFDSALIASDLDTELTNDFAILFKPGVVSNKNTLFYALVGPRWGNFKTSLSTDVLLVSDTQASATGSDSQSGYQLGLTAGLGIQHMLTDHFQVGLEYAYTNYGEIGHPSVDAEVIPHQTHGQTSVPDSQKIDAITHTMMFALSYQW